MPSVLAEVKGVDQRKRAQLLFTMEKLRRQAPSSLEAHARFIHRDDSDNPLIAFPHHREWIDLLEDRLTYPWLAIVAPPGYAKSTWFSWAYPAWRIGSTGGKIRMGLVGGTASQTWGWAGAIKDSITSPHFQMAYPDVRPDYQRGWKHDGFFTSGTPQGQNPTLSAMGVNGPIQGRRFDEIVLDDPTNYEQAQSPNVMDKQRNWLKNTLIKRIPAGYRPPNDPKGKARMVVVFTRWGPNDLYDTLKDLGFHMVTMPALGYWDAEYDHDGTIIPGLEPLWPESESAAYLEKERMKDELVFELVMQGNPRVVTGEMFDPTWWAEQRGNPPDRIDFERVVMAVDTASGKDARRGDYFAAAVVGKLGTDVWVLDVIRGRFNAMQQEDVVVEVARDWEPDLVVIESANEGEALYQRLVGQHLNLPLKRFQPTKDKAFRSAPLAAAYRQGHVWHSSAPWNMAYETELQAFPGGPHDDQVDAAAMAYSNLAEYGPRVRGLGPQMVAR